MLYIAEEMQIDLCRTGMMRCATQFGVQPDLVVTSKGLGGGLYPMGATLMSTAVSSWLHDNGWARVSTYISAEPGCCMALHAMVVDALPCEDHMATCEDVASRASAAAGP